MGDKRASTQPTPCMLRWKPRPPPGDFWPLSAQDGLKVPGVRLAAASSWRVKNFAPPSALQLGTVFHSVSGPVSCAKPTVPVIPGARGAPKVHTARACPDGPCHVAASVSKADNRRTAQVPAARACPARVELKVVEMTWVAILLACGLYLRVSSGWRFVPFPLHDELLHVHRCLLLSRHQGGTPCESPVVALLMLDTSSG